MKNTAIMHPEPASEFIDVRIQSLFSVRNLIQAADTRPR